jgi:hypothetical protein
VKDPVPCTTRSPLSADRRSLAGRSRLIGANLARANQDHK